ncbi:MAG: 50S ribosomal protein L18 [Deltaproteobacteria bacterium]|nr:50S ribosomal protein L18 [Deltaproteobacteria bacterium]MBW2041411.1 50S ribosomal protein L18 [Deltaproteobacteria bacterium]MBW2133085.1 50S ribosomal protein L18 [Deltaproteobacteria bacterium]
MGRINPSKMARLKRKKSIRKKIFGTPDRPRLCVFRSANHIYAQVVDDTKGQTLAAASSLEKETDAETGSGGKIGKAVIVGKRIAKRALDQGVVQVVFDRNGFLYHGRVKAVSDGAREAGLKF